MSPLILLVPVGVLAVSAIASSNFVGQWLSMCAFGVGIGGCGL